MSFSNTRCISSRITVFALWVLALAPCLQLSYADSGYARIESFRYDEIAPVCEINPSPEVIEARKMVEIDQGLFGKKLIISDQQAYISDNTVSCKSKMYCTQHAAKNIVLKKLRSDNPDVIIQEINHMKEINYVSIFGSQDNTTLSLAYFRAKAPRNTTAAPYSDNHSDNNPDGMSEFMAQDCVNCLGTCMACDSIIGFPACIAISAFHDQGRCCECAAIVDCEKKDNNDQLMCPIWACTVPNAKSC